MKAMHQVSIGVARLCGGDPGARGVLDRLAGTLDFRAPGLPPQAILVLRSLRLRLRKPLKAAANDARAVNAMEDELRETLRRARVGAARPSRMTPGQLAEAVYFADISELMACLARDWLAGAAASRWWWSAMLRGTSIERALLDYCARTPEAMPSMLGRLASTADAVRFVSKIAPAEASTLARAIAESFALDHDVDTLIAEDRGAPMRGAAPESSRARRIRAALPECMQPFLDHPAVLLLGLGLGLQRVPADVRSPVFVEFILRTFEAYPRARDAPAFSTPTAMPAHHDTQGAVLNQQGRAFTALHEPSRHSDPIVTMRSDFTSASGGRAAISRGDAVVSDSARDELHPPARESIEKPDGDPLAVAPEAAPATDAVDFASIEDGADELACQTRFGGMFYVLNVALHMGYYTDFTQPRARGLAASPWDFLAVCGRTWFGKRFVADPAWRLLASLAGRAPDEEPSEDFDHECLPRVLERIALALGERRPRRAISRLVFADSRVIDTGTHLDVHLDLAKLPLAVRYAGLDRDPGWIPAAGRIVAFHFD